MAMNAGLKAYLANKKKGATSAHPGFKSVANNIAAKQGVSQQSANAILASSSRNASAKAKKKNPRIKRVSMPMNPFGFKEHGTMKKSKA